RAALSLVEGRAGDVRAVGVADQRDLGAVGERHFDHERLAGPDGVGADRERVAAADVDDHRVRVALQQAVSGSGERPGRAVRYRGRRRRRGDRRRDRDPRVLAARRALGARHELVRLARAGRGGGNLRDPAARRRGRREPRRAGSVEDRQLQVARFRGVANRQGRVRPGRVDLQAHDARRRRGQDANRRGRRRGGVSRVADVGYATATPPPAIRILATPPPRIVSLQVDPPRPNAPLTVRYTAKARDLQLAILDRTGATWFSTTTPSGSGVTQIPAPPAGPREPYQLVARAEGASGGEDT